MENNKLQDKAIDIMEKFDYGVYIDDSGDWVEFETWTSGGVNMHIAVKSDAIIDNLINECKYFDVDEEIEMYRQNEDYKNNFTIRESLEDFEEYKQQLKEIQKELEELI